MFQIGVALVLVCLVLGLLHICYIQAELLLGRRRKLLVGAASPAAALGAASGAASGPAPSRGDFYNRLDKEWANLVEARVGLHGLMSM